MSFSDSSSSRASWLVNFPVPQFSYDSELKLDWGNATFKEDGTPLIPDPKLKSHILEALVQEIIKCKLYCSGKELNAVAKALNQKHPCLIEKGSLTGHAGWKASLANKLAMYRTHLRKLGCTEVNINSLKNKPEGKANPAASIKKPQRSQVNHCPPHPIGESDSWTPWRCDKDKQGSDQKKNGEKVLIQEARSHSRGANGSGLQGKMASILSHEWGLLCFGMFLQIINIKDTCICYGFVSFALMFSEVLSINALFVFFQTNAEFKRITTMLL